MAQNSKGHVGKSMPAPKSHSPLPGAAIAVSLGKF